MIKFPILFLLIAFIFFFSRCEQKSDGTKEQLEIKKQMQLDSFSRAKYGESAEVHVKKMTDSVISKAIFDTTGLYKSPVKILKANIVKEQYSSLRSVHLSYKNVSKKKINGIKFQWYGTTAFNEPADLGNSYVSGFGGGFTDDELRPGKIDGGTWNVLSRDAKSIKLAWPIEVSFADGSIWKLK
ncbi:MAG: hypothetical protein EOP45_17715 [Sphingobacteriaceae bacterium]|nr:MAG: hypothetical protein EOP45_17715 [Sphingobacteriaceae bacterium]